MATRETGEYLAANQALWDEWAEIHAHSEWYDLEAVRQGNCKLRPYELEEVGDVEGRRLLHLQCQIGTDTVCWARRGASATGVDFSPRAVAIATDLARELGVDARFVCADVLLLPDLLGGRSTSSTPPGGCFAGSRISPAGQRSWRIFLLPAGPSTSQRSTPSPRRSSPRASPSHGRVTPTSRGRSRLPFQFRVRMPTQPPKSPSPSSTSGPTAWVSW